MECVGVGGSFNPLRATELRSVSHGSHNRTGPIGALGQCNDPHGCPSRTASGPCDRQFQFLRGRLRDLPSQCGYSGGATGLRSGYHPDRVWVQSMELPTGKSDEQMGWLERSRVRSDASALGRREPFCTALTGFEVPLWPSCQAYFSSVSPKPNKTHATAASVAAMSASS